MSKITGNERSWWHDDRGHHRMPDLRHTDYPRKFWDDDERAYHAHLDRHDELAERPEPEATDSASIKALFALVDSLEQSAATARRLIVSLRNSDSGK